MRAAQALMMGAGASAYDADFLAWESYLSTPLTTPNKVIFNQFFLDIKGIGNIGSVNNFAELDRLWVLASQDQQGARISLKNPSSTAMTEVNSPTWTQYRGYAGDAVSKRIVTNFTPSTDGVKFTQTSASMFVYSRTNTAATVSEIGAISGTNKSFLVARNTSNVASYPLNYNTGLGSPTVANTDSSGLFSININSGTLGIYRAGSLLTSTSVTSQPLNNIPFWLLGINDGASGLLFSARQISVAGFGSGNVDNAKLQSAINALKTSLGF